jgi:FkbM family methyltransferase
MKFLFKKIISIFVVAIDKIFPSAFDDAMNRLINHKIDGQNVDFVVLGQKSRSRSTIAFYKEPDTTAWIDSFENNSCFIDIGSNIGVFSIYAALKKKCFVYSFDPSLNANFIFLMNIAKNKLKSKVFLHPVLLSNNQSSSQFLETSIPNDRLDNLSGFAFMDGNTNKPNLLKNLNHANYFVPSFKLDDFNFERPVDYIKIDVDGVELDVIKSGLNTINQSSVKSIMIELDRSDKKKYEEILSILNSSKFNLDETLNSISRKSKKRNNNVYNHFFFKEK